MTFRMPIAALLCSLLLYSCGSSFEIEGEPDWLEACRANDECEDAGLECICGVCTKVCDKDEDCGDLAGDAEDAACVPADESGRARQCQPEDPVDESVCDASCRDDDDCEALGEDHACQAGFCRRQASDGTDGGHEPEDCDDKAGGARTCLTSALLEQIDVQTVEAVDLLFVVDDSRGMSEAQASLRRELPRMITVLTTGDYEPDDGIEIAKDFSPAKSLHLAVVSADMGLPGMQPSPAPDNICHGLGDDGLFQHVQIDPTLSCRASYPLFLSYVAPESDDRNELLLRAEAVANDFGCIATLGTRGCGFGMPLEAALKALWPTEPDNMSSAQQAMSISFLDDPFAENSEGHGDGPHREFLRGTSYHSSESDQLSVLAIIMLTDEEDCSAGRQGTLDFLEDPSSAPPDVADQPVGLRCFYDQENRYPVERYTEAFKRLRPGYEHLVVFGAIVGVPPEINEMDFDQNGDGERNRSELEGFYDAILQHPDMLETITPEGQETFGNPGRGLMPTCYIDNAAYDPSDPMSSPFITKAAPARRIVEVARGFGPNGVVRSICRESFASAMDAIVRPIFRQLGGDCLARELERDAEGKVDCNVLLEMPVGRDCPGSYTEPPPADEPQTTSDGRNICVVDQLPVIRTGAQEVARALGPDHGQGWYYDDFIPERRNECRRDAGDPVPPRIAFALTGAEGGQTADPPSGVTVRLQCSKTVPSMAGVEPVAMGQSCGVVDCEDPAYDIFCHPGSWVCVSGCETDADCPEAWVCDDSREAVEGDPPEMPGAGRPFCVNRACESHEAQARNCGNSDVGAFCVPELIPPGGFDDSEVYLETNSASCDTRICGVFFLQGDPSRDCDPTEPGANCADRAEDCVAGDTSCAVHRAHCTCRCDAPDDPWASTCRCPSGYGCEPIVDLGGPGVAGSYCVKEGLGL